MHIKFILPRFHTNMFYPTKVLLENNYDVSIDCAYRGFNENYSCVKSNIIPESFISKFLKKIISSESNKMNKYYLPKPILYKNHFKKNLPDVIIIRPYNTFFFLNILILSKFYKRQIILYNQINSFDLKKFNFIKKTIYWILTNFLNIKIVSPLFLKAKLPKKYFLLPFVSEKIIEYRKKKYDFLLVGKLNKKKNYNLFLQAISEIKNNFSVKIVAEISNKEHRDEYKKLKKIIRIYKLKKNVSISLNINHKDMNNFYDKSKCFVLATDGDLAPISIIEALCRKCYVLCSDTCGTKNYISKGQNGYVFKTNNLVSLKRNIIKISKIYDKKSLNYKYDSLFFMKKIKKIIEN